MAELISLPDGLSTVAAWIIVGATMATAFVSAIFGVGGGTILLAVLAILLPPTALIPVHGVVQLGANASRALLLLPSIRRSMLLPFVVGTGIGSALSGVMFIQLPPWLIQYAVAGFILWSIFGVMPAFGSRHTVAAGAFSGFLTILFGATGPFVSAFVKSMRLPPVTYVATHAALMSLQHALKIMVFGLLGFAFGPYALLMAMMIAAGFIGTCAGRRVLLEFSDRRFRPLLDAILLLLALRLVWMATASFLQGQR